MSELRVICKESKFASEIPVHFWVTPTQPLISATVPTGYSSSDCGLEMYILRVFQKWFYYYLLFPDVLK
jgi:hypothetical protein